MLLLVFCEARLPALEVRLDRVAAFPAERFIGVMFEVGPGIGPLATLSGLRSLGACESTEPVMAFGR